MELTMVHSGDKIPVAICFSVLESGAWLLSLQNTLGLEYCILIAAMFVQMSLYNRQKEVRKVVKCRGYAEQLVLFASLTYSTGCSFFVFLI